MASQAQKNTISLKGSSKMICDFLDYGSVNEMTLIHKKLFDKSEAFEV